MNEYDSILKEKKVYSSNIVSVRRKRRRKIFFLDFLVVIFILIGSYIYYYRYILSGSNVFLYDIHFLWDSCAYIFEPLAFDLSDGVEGNIIFDQYRYDYEFGYDDSNYFLTFSRDKEDLSYFFNGNRLYTKVSSFMNHSWIEKNSSYARKNIDAFIDKDAFIKKFYMSGGTPIVEVNYSMNQDVLNQLVGFDLFHDDIDFIFTFKNHAVSDQFLSGKLIINNKSKNTRNLLEYKDGDFVLTLDNGKVISFRLRGDRDNFTLKIFKDNVLFSVFSGIKKDDSYLYSYQVIDQFYNLSFNTYVKEENRYIDFVSNIEKNDKMIEKKATVILKKGNSYTDININGKVDENNLNKEMLVKYQETIRQFFLPIREFIFEYKDGIN